MLFLWLLKALLACWSLCNLSTNQIQTAIHLGRVLKHDIQLTQPLSQSPDDAPDVLPLSVSEFLSEATNVPIEAISSLWIAIKDDVWTTSTAEENCESNKERFQLFGWKHGLSKQFLTLISLLI